MITNHFNSFLGAIPMALALNTLTPVSAAAQDKPGTTAPAADKPLTFDPKNIPPDAMDAGFYTGFNTSVTKRDDEANHASRPHRAPNKKDQICKDDGDVCGDVSKVAKTYIADWTAYADAIKAADQGSEEATFNGTAFRITPKLAKKGEDILFTEEIRCYTKIFAAADVADGTEDGIVKGSGLAKLLAKVSPERAKLERECKVDSFGDDDLARETYLTSAIPIVAGLTKIVYEGRESMVQGYAPQEELDALQGKLDEANDELGKNKKALEKANQDIGDLQTAREAAEAEAKKFKYATIGAGGLLALGLLIMIGLRLKKGRSQASPAPKIVTKPKEPETEAQPTTPEKKPETKEEKPETKTEAKSNPEPEADTIFLDDIDQALEESKGHQTPSSAAEPKPAETQPPAPESV